ncbi:OmpA family protein [Marilutibacter alkalisoli]|uniref:OmpA family protein n=1 Tax=Marilutibacter alkalisoli TaxID=2591633 RepID=UPI001FC9E604|nr:OmpA family protein [Lysobacter alkalisoli]
MTSVDSATTGADVDAAPAAAPAVDSATEFDITSVPVSQAALGEFPYFALPTGYEPRSWEARDFDRFPFWVGDRFEWVEGKLWSTFIGAVDGKKMSQYEVKRNLDHVIAGAGGTKIFEGQVPNAAVESLGRGIMVEHNTGLGGIASEPSTVWLLRRPDRNIWVYLNTYSAGGSLAIAESEAFLPTAALIPASELRQKLNADGRIALQVNFAIDKADILSESQPQIEQVLQLLREDSTLKLSVNGHTDSTGDANHNQALSEARAQAVVAALVEQGIDAARLEAAGFGQSQPVADNDTEAGKAQNRRVELMRLP